MRPLWQTAIVACLTAQAAQMARADEMPRVSLQEALMLAREQHPRLKEVEALVAARDADTAVPRAQWLPRVGAAAQMWLGSTNNSTAQILGTSAVDLPRIGGTPHRRSNLVRRECLDGRGHRSAPADLRLRTHPSPSIR